MRTKARVGLVRREQQPVKATTGSPAPRCTCGHVFSSHQDPDDPYNPFSQRCKTCGCAAYLDRMESVMQSDEGDDDPETSDD